MCSIDNLLTSEVASEPAWFSQMRRKTASAAAAASSQTASDSLATEDTTSAVGLQEMRTNKRNRPPMDAHLASQAMVAKRPKMAIERDEENEEDDGRRSLLSVSQLPPRQVSEEHAALMRGLPSSVLGVPHALENLMAQIRSSSSSSPVTSQNERSPVAFASPPKMSLDKRPSSVTSREEGELVDEEGDRASGHRCKFCNKRFASPSNVVIHERTHTGEKPYVCPFNCGKAFSDKGAHKKHIMVHTGEKPFECKTCGKKFRQSCHLRRHEQGRQACLLEWRHRQFNDRLAALAPSQLSTGN